MRQTRMRPFIFAILTLACMAAACRSGNESARIRIGAVLPLTGDSAAWGQQGRWGIEAAVNEINNDGGINGHPLEVLFEDTQAQPRIAVSTINKLISVYKVPAVIGDIVSATTLAMAPIAETNHVVLIAPTASAPAISDAGAYIFRLWPSDYLEGTELARWMYRNGYKRIAALYISTDYGQGLLKAFRETFERNGGSIVESVGYSQDETNFRSYLLRIQSAQPQAIYLISYYKDAALALRQAAELRLPYQFFGATAVESKDLLTLAGKAAEGLRYPTITDFDAKNPNALQQKFITAFRSLFKSDPDWASSHTYDALMLIAEVLKGGAQTGTDIQQAIDRRRDFNGVTGRIHFDDKGDVTDKPVAMKIVKNGQFEFLESNATLGEGKR